MSSSDPRAASDAALLARIAPRLEKYRLRRNRTQAQLAEEAGISKRTLERIEAGQPVQLVSFLRLCRALDLLDGLDLLVPEPAPSPLQLAELRGRERRRATPSSQGDELAEPTPAPWTWGEDT